MQVSDVVSPMQLVPQSTFVRSDAQGNTMVTWSAEKLLSTGATDGRESWFRRRTSAGVWQAPARIRNGYSSMVALGMNSQGATGALLRVMSGTTPELWFARYAPSSGFGPARPLVTPWESFEAKVKVRDDGSAVAIWNDSNGGVYARISSTDGTEWGSATELVKIADSGPHSLRLALDSDGAPVVTWLQRTTTNDVGYTLRVSRFQAATGWSAPADLAGNVSWEADLAAGFGAKAVVIWRDWNRIEPVESRHLLTDTWTPATLVSADTTTTSTNANYSPEQRVVNSARVSIAVWGERIDPMDNNSTMLLWSNILFPDGWKQRAPVTPAGGAPIFVSEIDLAATADGGTAVWRQDGGGGASDIWASRLR